jgi:hypothetical protein
MKIKRDGISYREEDVYRRAIEFNSLRNDGFTTRQISEFTGFSIPTVNYHIRRHAGNMKFNKKYRKAYGDYMCR